MNNPNTHPSPAVIADLRAGLDAAKRLREHLPGDAPELQQADDTIAAIEAAIDAAEPSRKEPEDDLAYLRDLNRRLRNQVGGVQAELRAAKREHAGLAEENAALQDQISALRADNDALNAKWEAGHIEAMETRIALNQEAAQCDELRADNDARGVLIEQLRADLARREDANVRLLCERDNAAEAAAEAGDELATVRSERDAVHEELTAYRDTNVSLCRELDDATMKLDNVRRARDKYFAAYQRTLRALNAALGEP